MRSAWTGTLLMVFLSFVRPAAAQHEAPASSAHIIASQAFTWTSDGTSIAQLEGPVRITLDKTVMTAQQAVVWITPVRGSLSDLRRFEVTLVGDARLELPNQVVRTDRRRLYVDAIVRDSIRVTAARRLGRDQSQSPLYRLASEIRPVILKGNEPSGRWILQEEPPATRPTEPTDTIRPLQPVTLSMDQFSTDKTPDGKVVAILSGNILLRQSSPQGDYIELMADRAVIFTPYDSLAQLNMVEKIRSIEEAVLGAYLEGDVRIIRTPRDARTAEQRLNANRAYYDFTTDRAVLTDVVLHTMEPTVQIPIIMRARMVRQLSEREYTAEDARLSTSSFRTPSYSIGASSAYIRQTETGSEVTGDRTTFSTKNTTFDLFGMPIFYLPATAGSFTERGWLRRIETSSSSGFGFGVSSEWGLFETLGRLPPKGTDLTYRLDYYSDRGPAIGLDGRYQGGFVDDTTLEPWSYGGDFTSYVAYDDGEDNLGRKRVDVEPEDELRGRFYWEHQHFFPGDWQVQLAGGYISDPTFLEEWFNRDFRNGRAQDTSIYIKRQRDTEAFTFLTSIQPNDFTTVAEFYQEQAEVERLPELGYRRIGDSFWQDKATFFSANTVSALRFDESDESLADLGFARAPVGRYSPGIPSIGQTGTPDDTTYRGDTRQELTFPFSLGRFRVVPFVVGRYTAYSESVDGGTAERLHASAGLRLTTAFWKVDDTVKSNLWDLQRLRHVIEPELNLYAGAQSEDRSALLIYDEPVDAISDVSAVQFALNQRWQTKRGGPGRWRSVDFFKLNIAANYFFSQPPDIELNPADFRGLFFVTMPEASVPRNGVNADAAWRVSDSVTVLSDAKYNTDESMLATASIGLSVRQDQRLSYYLGLRHVGLDFTQIIDGNTFVFEDRDLFIFAADYQLTSKYRLNFANSYDFAQSRNDRSTVSFIRRFDRFFVAVSFRLDEFQDEQAIFFNVWPEGLEPGGGSRAVQSTFLR